MFWKPLIRRISNGEPVDAAVSNRGIDDLVDRTEWLKRRFESLQPQAGRVILSGAPVEGGVQLGNWVYFDPDMEVYRPGLARMEITGLAMPRPAHSAHVAGVVTAKTGPTEADILFVGESTVGDGGAVQIPSMAYMLEEGEEFSPGEFYLSASEPGRMTATPSGAPVVRLGSFSEGRMHVSVQARLLHDGHVHHRFALKNEPSSGEWSSIDDGEDPVVVEHGFVDYADDAHRGEIQISVGVTPGMVWDGVRRRIVVKKSGTALVIKSSLLSWLGTETEESEIQVTPPEYGDLLDLVAGSGSGSRIGVSVSFVRPDFFIDGPSVYSNGFLSDFLSDVPDTKGWSIDLPDALSGWTNCCPEAQASVPGGASLRYISEGQADLSSLFPVSPLSSPILTVSGIDADESWTRTHSDLYWVDGSASSGEDWGLPWSEDYEQGDNATLEPAFLSFETSPHGDSDPVVRALFSNSSILKFVKAGTDSPASTGAMELVLDYRAIVDEETESDPAKCLAGVSPDGQSFLTGPRVSSITAGPNILVRRVLPDGSLSESGTNSGPVRIDLASVSSFGASPSFSLFNAKESERNGVSFIEFLPPAQAATAAVARIPVPNLDVPGDQDLRIEIATQWMGLSSGTGGPALAVMRMEVRVVRPGVNLASLSAPSEVLALGIDIASDYPSFRVMDEELVETHPIEGAILPGDQVFVRFSREVNSPAFQVGPAASLEDNSLDPDDYSGRVALVSTKWRIFAE